MKTSVTAIPLILITLVKNARYSSLPPSTVSIVRYDDQECEFPPKTEEDLTSIRRKRLTTEDGLVCLEDYPYTVSIRLDGKHWCGGAIIGSKWILSAAQCFDYIDEAEVTVRMGSVFRNFGGKIVAVESIKRHPSYQLNRYYPEHNLAMLKLKIPIVPGPRIQSVQLPPPNADVPSFTGEIVVTGYGAVGYSLQLLLTTRSILDIPKEMKAISMKTIHKLMELTIFFEQVMSSKFVK